MGFVNYRNAGFLAVIPLAMMSAQDADAAYDVENIIVPGASSPSFFGINNSSSIAGTATYAGVPQSILFQNGVTTILPIASVTGSSAFGVSDGGIVVGQTIPDSSGVSQTSYIYANGTVTQFALNGNTDVQLRGISPNGRYVSGFYNDSTTGLEVGFVDDLSGVTPTQIIPNPDNFILPQGINDSGLVAGSRNLLNASGGIDRSGFLYNSNTQSIQDYPMADALASAFRGINSQGVIAGWEERFDGSIVGLGGAPDSPETFAVAGASYTQAEGINDQGEIVGGWLSADGNVGGAFVAIPVPEPTEMVLTLMGLCALGFALNRKASRPRGS